MSTVRTPEIAALSACTGSPAVLLGFPIVIERAPGTNRLFPGGAPAAVHTGLLIAVAVATNKTTTAPHRPIGSLGVPGAAIGVILGLMKVES